MWTYWSPIILFILTLRGEHFIVNSLACKSVRPVATVGGLPSEDWRSFWAYSYRETIILSTCLDSQLGYMPKTEQTDVVELFNSHLCLFSDTPSCPNMIEHDRSCIEERQRNSAILCHCMQDIISHKKFNTTEFKAKAYLSNYSTDKLGAQCQLHKIFNQSVCLGLF